MMSEERRSSSEEVRRMLDELGIEHADASYKRNTPITVWTSGDSTFCFVEEPTKHTDLHIEECTPEQAIAATVGEESKMRICKRCGVAYELNIIDKGFGKPRFCPNCGKKNV